MDAQVLLADILHKPKAWLVAHPETRMDDAQQAVFRQAVSQLEAGLPLPYALGHWEFYGLDFLITPDVLIPRPETELLVEESIQFLSKLRSTQGSAAQLDGRPFTAVDVGTGSGIIAICLAKAIPGLSVLAVDRSRAALTIAARNAGRHGAAQQIAFLQSDLLIGVDGKFDLVAANLPYIPSPALSELAVAKFEPRLALDGGPEGLSIFRRLFADCARLVAPGGRIYLEIEAGRGAATQNLAEEFLPQAVFTIKNDLQGHERLLIISM